MIVPVEGEAAEFATSRTVDYVPAEGAIMKESHTQTCIGEQSTAETGEPKEWEILRSIVYGGLVESITSLGIVASAASSGATPCKCSLSPHPSLLWWLRDALFRSDQLIG